MTPTKLSITGSFKDRIEYLFKGAENDNDRVLFDTTQNLFSDARNAAWEMAETSRNQDRLKQAAGVRKGGKKSKRHVRHDVLSWADGETPDAAEMERAARSFLKHMGLEEHEAVIVGHGDTKRRHVHIITNTVNPNTGKIANFTDDHDLAQAWAAEYEKENGVIHCHKRGTPKADGEKRKRLSRAEWEAQQRFGEAATKFKSNPKAAIAAVAERVRTERYKEAWAATWKDAKPTYDLHRAESEWASVSKRWVPPQKRVETELRVSKRGRVYPVNKTRTVRGHYENMKPNYWQRRTWTKENADRFRALGLEPPSFWQTAWHGEWRGCIKTLHKAEKEALKKTRAHNARNILNGWVNDEVKALRAALSARAARIPTAYLSAASSGVPPVTAAGAVKELAAMRLGAGDVLKSNTPTAKPQPLGPKRFAAPAGRPMPTVAAAAPRQEDEFDPATYKSAADEIAPLQIPKKPAQSVPQVPTKRETGKPNASGVLKVPFLPFKF